MGCCGLHFISTIHTRPVFRAMRCKRLITMRFAWTHVSPVNSSINSNLLSDPRTYSNWPLPLPQLSRLTSNPGTLITVILGLCLLTHLPHYAAVSSYVIIFWTSANQPSETRVQGRTCACSFVFHYRLRLSWSGSLIREWKSKD